MLQASCRPIGVWPGGARRASYSRLGSPFKAGFVDTLSLLERELAHLRARDVVIEIDLPESQIRNDGWPYAGARPNDPGVVLCFYSERLGAPLKYPCDRFTGWQDNLRAIALALEALRKVDRYGVTKRGEQYTGWKALPPKTSGPIPITTVNEAMAVLVRHNPGRSVGSLSSAPMEEWRKAVREAQRVTHPDTGGNAADFQRVQDAVAYLKTVGWG